MPPHILLYGEPHQFSNYERALTLAGAVVRFGDGADCDALVLPGGGDIHPERYGRPWQDCRQVDPDRDAAELALFHRFFAQGKPILGICRGMQLTNVALGGTLHQNIEGHSASGGVDGLHTTSALPDSFLAQLYGRNFTVNTAHHQAADQLGAGLLPVQWAPDGVVEAVVHRERPVWGVQWHPERLEEGGRRADTVDGQRIFTFFLEQCPY